MLAEQKSDHKFSIFNALITNDHREFYEKIINELIGVSPICNQGKCTAAAISETEYGLLGWAAQTSADLYRMMYEEALSGT